MDNEPDKDSDQLINEFFSNNDALNDTSKDVRDALEELERLMNEHEDRKAAEKGILLRFFRILHPTWKSQLKTQLNWIEAGPNPLSSGCRRAFPRSPANKKGPGNWIFCEPEGPSADGGAEVRAAPLVVAFFSAPEAGSWCLAPQILIINTEISVEPLIRLRRTSLCCQPRAEEALASAPEGVGVLRLPSLLLSGSPSSRPWKQRCNPKYVPDLHMLKDTRVQAIKAKRSGAGEPRESKVSTNGPVTQINVTAISGGSMFEYINGSSREEIERPMRCNTKRITYAPRLNVPLRDLHEPHPMPRPVRGVSAVSATPLSDGFYRTAAEDYLSSDDDSDSDQDDESVYDQHAAR
ncbi:hypothetical protein B0H66DRAFT_529026 [Apodospora peruviana]|uniref:Uncharacterized protein n=1 Tax=Apodospora peruviana TaxID=516989 RepID=A0AAE0IGZ3_9PEZI|nr:hypothetical protein B0H66DRAFT_529026 [Apodospora peruviana]